MNNVGLNYLELSRAANTFRVGEAQRIRWQLKSVPACRGIVCLDEPSIVYTNEIPCLIETLNICRDLGTP